MLSTLFKSKPTISIGFFLSSLSLVAGQEVDQHQNAINMALTLLGGSLTICCLFICAFKCCMRYDRNVHVNLNLEDEIDIVRNDGVINDDNDNNNGITRYVRMID